MKDGTDQELRGPSMTTVELATGRWKSGIVEAMLIEAAWHWHSFIQRIVVSTEASLTVTINN